MERVYLTQAVCGGSCINARGFERCQRTGMTGFIDWRAVSPRRYISTCTQVSEIVFKLGDLNKILSIRLSGNTRCELAEVTDTALKASWV